MRDEAWNRDALMGGCHQQGSTRETQVLDATRCDFNSQTCSSLAQVTTTEKYRFRARFPSQTLRLTSRQPPLALSYPAFMSPSKTGRKDHHGHQKLQPHGTVPDAAAISLLLVLVIRAAMRKL